MGQRQGHGDAGDDYVNGRYLCWGFARGERKGLYIVKSKYRLDVLQS